MPPFLLRLCLRLRGHQSICLKALTNHRPPKNAHTHTTTKQTLKKKQFTTQVIGAADAEFGSLCGEMDVEAQLADLEALCMRRGLSAEAQQ